MPATIEIGGCKLEVKECTIGFWKRLRAFTSTETTDGAASIDGMVGFFLELLGHNEGVTREWLEERLPMNGASMNAKCSELLAAGGLTTQEKPSGEARTQ